MTLHSWLDSWTGLRLIVATMERYGYALSLTRIRDGGWRATFYSSPLLSTEGFATAPTQWAVMRGAA